MAKRAVAVVDGLADDDHSEREEFGMRKSILGATLGATASNGGKRSGTVLDEKSWSEGTVPNLAEPS